MSHKASHWIAELPPEAMNSGAFRVLFHLCDAHNSKRDPQTACFPSQCTLRKVTGLSNGGLNDALNRLEKTKLISRRRTRKPDGKNGPTFYILGCDMGWSPTPYSGVGDDANLQPKPTPKYGDGTNSSLGAEPTPVLGHNQLQSTGDKPVREPVKEPVSARGASVDDLDLDLSKQEEPKPAAKSAGGATGVPETRTPVEIEFDLFMKASPRELDESAKEAEFQKAWPAFQKASTLVDAQTLTKSMRAYAKSCKRSGKIDKYIKYPSTWLADKRWRDFPCAKSPSAKSADQATKLDFYADILNGDEPFHPSLISSPLADELYESGKVTAQRLRERMPG